MLISPGFVEEYLPDSRYVSSLYPAAPEIRVGIPFSVTAHDGGLTKRISLFLFVASFFSVFIIGDRMTKINHPSFREAALFG